MLTQWLNIIFTSSNIMLGIIILLGIIIFFKFSNYLLKIIFFRKTNEEPVFKDLIKKSDDIKPLN